MRDDFAVFILSHGRAEKCLTLETLRRCGFTGKVFIVIDDEDEQKADYFSNYGSDIVVEFCKKDYVSSVDTITIVDNPASPTFARNAVCDIAKQHGVKYFGMFDDDLTNFLYRYNDSGSLRKKDISDLDKIFEYMLDFMDISNADCFAFTNAGGLIGGVSGRFSEGLRRQAAATFIIRTESYAPFVGVYNEDMNYSLLKARKGQLVFELTKIAFYTCERGDNSGGLHDLYASKDWYFINFHSVVCLPDVCKIQPRNGNAKLKINWVCSIPQIISGRWKK